MNRLRLLAVFAVLSGCATTPPVSELRGDAKTAVFVQYGEKPLSVGYGIVDGKTFWASLGGGGGTQISDASSNAANVPGATQQQAAAGGLLVAAASDMAQESVNSEREEIEATMRGFLEGTDYANHIIAGIQPALAKKWQVEFVDSKKIPLKSESALVADDGAFIGDVPQADLVFMVSVNSVVLNEANVAAGFVHALALGAGERNVRPVPSIGISVFKADRASGRYLPVWRMTCGAYLSGGPAHTVSEMKEFPALAKSVFTESIPPSIESCNKQIAARP